MRAFVLLGAACLPLTTTIPASAAIPADYKGKPFDPALAGGVGIIPSTVKAGPYPIPGRLDFVNYDLGGEMLAFHAGDHITNKEGSGYRTDAPTATLSKTSNAKPDVWFGTGTAMDGMFYPSMTTSDFYIGAVQVNDWFNFTVDVKAAGMYTLSSTWSSGNGPPGGEGGDGAMGLQVFVNGTKVADWKDSFPNYQTTANFHNWKPYPNFATIALEAGPQLIKLQCTSKHLNLDYVDFEPVGAGGSTGTAGSAGSAAANGGAAGNGGTASSAGGADTTGGATSAGGAANAGGGAAAGAPAGTAGAAGNGTNSAGSDAGGSTAVDAGAGAGNAAPAANSGCSCTLPASGRTPFSAALIFSGLVGLAALGRRRQR